MIVYPLTPPLVFCAQAVTMRAHNVVSTTAAPWSGVEQIQEWQGGHWELEIKFPTMKPSDGEAIVGFLDSLRGKFGTFLYAPPNKARPRGAARTAAGAPTVQGGLQTGLTLDIATTGLGNVKTYLRSGDFLAIPYGNSRGLYRVTRDADLIGNRARLNIWPRLRAIPNHGDPVTIYDPLGMFRLSVDDPQHRVDENGFYQIDVLPIREAFGQ